jgi:cytosine/adenosine deaminase-related metal-dependent hydrolase
MLLQRLSAALGGASLSGEDAPPLLTGRQALELATRGGAAVLGRADLGSLETGKCADFAAIRLDSLAYAGGLHDPVAALIFCAPQQVDRLVVGGRSIVEDGQLITLDVPRLVERHNHAARRLLDA